MACLQMLPRDYLFVIQNAMTDLGVYRDLRMCRIPSNTNNRMTATCPLVLLSWNGFSWTGALDPATTQKYGLLLDLQNNLMTVLYTEPNLYLKQLVTVNTHRESVNEGSW